jgi:hypothetical protein
MRALLHQCSSLHIHKYNNPFNVIETDMSLGYQVPNEKRSYYSVLAY